MTSTSATNAPPSAPRGTRGTPRFIRFEDTLLLARRGDGVAIRCNLLAYQAAELRNELLRYAALEPEQLLLDISALQNVNTAIAQVLIAFKRHFPHARIVVGTAALQHRLERVGLWQLLV